MNATAALCKALLDGKVINIKTGFSLFGVSNVPREIGRSVERKFGVRIDRTPREGESRYGQHVTWYDYKLNKSLPENKEGVAAMRLYLAENMGEYRPKTKEPQKAENDLLSELL